MGSDPMTVLIPSRSCLLYLSTSGSTHEDNSFTQESCASVRHVLSAMTLTSGQVQLCPRSVMEVCESAFMHALLDMSLWPDGAEA